MKAEIKLGYTTILHGPRKALGLSQNEYSVAALVYHLSNNPRSQVKGWCYASKEQLAAFLDISRRTIHRIVQTLVEKGLVEKQEETCFLRTTSKWYDEVESVTVCDKTAQGVGKSGTHACDKTAHNTNTNTTKDKKDSAAAPPDLFSKAANLNREIVHQDYVDAYWQWYEAMVGEAPHLLEADHKALKSIRQYLMKVKGESTKALSSWLYILSNWGKLEDFLQKQARPTQINSNMANIRLQLREQLNKVTKDTKKMIM